MSKLAIWIWISLVAAVGLLWLDFTMAGVWLIGLTACLPVIFFWLGRRFFWRWAADVALVGFAALAAVGLLLAITPVWLVLGFAAALIAWDLQGFAWRIQAAGQINGEQRLVNGHLLRILLCAGLGVLSAAVGLLARTQFGLGAAVLLGILAVLGLSQATAFLRKS